MSLEVDSIFLDDSHSDYGSSGYGIGTASLDCSINEFVFRHGRRYYTYYGTEPEKSLVPADKIEKDRIDLHHEVFLLLLGGELHEAPLDNPQRILDIGTGTGIWAIDMADKFPMAEVIGTDITPIRPLWVPSNCRFELDDVENDWTYPKDSIDFIHARNIAYAINDWKKFTAQSIFTLRSGGYIELGEYSLLACCDDGTMLEDNGVKVWLEHQVRAMEMMGRPTPTKEQLRKRLEDAGFEDVIVKSYKQPLGPWVKNRTLKQVGAMCMVGAVKGYHAFGMVAFTNFLGLTEEEAERICTNAARSSRNKNYHVYNNLHIAYGRKP